MTKNKYDERGSVCWRDIVKCVEWALRVRFYEADRYIERVYIDRRYELERLEHDLERALSRCERVFYHFELLNSLRRFLRYKPKTVEQLKIRRCFEFYEENRKTPCSGSLPADTTGGQKDIE